MANNLLSDTEILDYLEQQALVELTPYGVTIQVPHAPPGEEYDTLREVLSASINTLPDAE